MKKVKAGKGNLKSPAPLAVPGKFTSSTIDRNGAKKGGKKK